MIFSSSASRHMQHIAAMLLRSFKEKGCIDLVHLSLPVMMASTHCAHACTLQPHGINAGEYTLTGLRIICSDTDLICERRLFYPLLVCTCASNQVHLACAGAAMRPSTVVQVLLRSQ